MGRGREKERAGRGRREAYESTAGSCYETTKRAAGVTLANYGKEEEAFSDGEYSTKNVTIIIRTDSGCLSLRTTLERSYKVVALC